MMRRPDQQPDAALEKIIETARLALADERRILSPELEDILLRNCTSPIAGLIGGHLLWWSGSATQAVTCPGSMWW